MKYQTREAHPLEKILERLAIKRGDLERITNKDCVVKVLSTPGAEISPKLKEWLSSVGVDTKYFKTVLDGYWKRIKERNANRNL